MIFSIIILIAIALITYFHYAQGFFSATVSAIIAVLSAVLSVSYSETIVNSLMRGKMADNGQGVVMLLLFALSYLFLRTIFDIAVPGNLRFPAIVDVVGGAAMGLVAAIFATGVFALAAESMALGGSILGFSSLPMKSGSRAVVIRGERNMIDAVVTSEVDADSMDPAKQKTLLVPVDNIVLGLVEHLSDNGSLAGDRTFASIHPNWPMELFGERAGVQVGAMRTALNFAPTYDWVKLSGVYEVPSLPTADGELKAVRGPWSFPSITTPKPDQALLVIRVSVDHNAADNADGLFRFSTGAVRLTAGEKDFYPLGTLYNASKLLMQRPDDPLYVDLSGGGGTIDFAFLVDRADAFGSASEGAAGPKLAMGSFLSVKRYGLIDLGGTGVKTRIPAPPDSGPLRKLELVAQDSLGGVVTAAPASATPGARTPGAPGAVTPPPVQTPVAPPAEAALVISASTAKVSIDIPHSVGVNTTDVNGQNIAVAGGTVSLTDSRMSVVKIDGSATLVKLATGDNQLTELYVPGGQKLVQISTEAKPPASWYANAAALSVSDTAGKQYPCSGVFASVGSGFFIQYAAGKLTGTTAAPGGQARAATYLFVVPSGTELKSVDGVGPSVPVSLIAK